MIYLYLAKESAEQNRTWAQMKNCETILKLLWAYEQKELIDMSE